MRYLSVCSGIEAATVAWEPLGWKAAAYSEIEAFPSKVLNHHYPEVRNLGDMTKFEEWDIGTIDLLVGGTPCQSFSVAGLRKGLDDPRGNLMLTYLAIARRHRPKWLVWENVPGVLSSNGGEDFASLLRGLVELGYGWAYRILDAQYFGVAQRRRRVFVVGCLGDWRSAAAVLFERSSLSGHPAPSREKRQRVTSSSQAGPTYGGSNPNLADTVTSKWAKGSGGPAGNEAGLFVAQPVGIPDVMSTLLSSTAGISRPGNEATEHETYIPMAFGVGEEPDTAHCLRSQASKADKHESTTYIAQPMAFTPSSIGDYKEGVGTLRANGGDVGGGSENLIAQPIALQDIRGIEKAQGGKGWSEDGVSYTLDTHATQGVAQPIPIDSMNHIGRRDDHSFADFEPGAPSYTLTKGHHHAVAQPIPIACIGGQHPNAAMDIEKSPTLTNAMGSGGGHIPLVNQSVAQPIGFEANMSMQQPSTGNVFQTLTRRTHASVNMGMAVRRLTPVECERLQGFPDNYTRIPWRKGETPDGPRYKALGNSMAVPVMAWIGQRIQAIHDLSK